MPQINGHELARRIREQPRHAGVLLVALSGWSAREVARTHTSGAAGATPFDPHLIKPVSFAALTDLLALLNGVPASVVQ